MRIQACVAAAILAMVAAGAFASFPSITLADNPSRGQVLVPGDHHLPGEVMEVTGYQLDPGMALQLSLVSPSRTATLASVTVLPDGTFSTSATVPADFPTGYADLVATGGGGTWKTVMLVGERAEGPKPADAVGTADATSTLALVMFAIGLIVFLLAAAWYLRGRLRFGR